MLFGASGTATAEGVVVDSVPPLVIPPDLHRAIVDGVHGLANGYLANDQQVRAHAGLLSALICALASGSANPCRVS